MSKKYQPEPSSEDVDDQSLLTEEEEDYEDDVADSFIADDDDDLEQRPVKSRREIEAELDKQNEQKKEREQLKMQQIRDKFAEEEIITTAVDDKDPDLYRIPLRRGQGLKCCMHMTQFLAKQNYKVQQKLSTLSYNVISVTYAPNDPEGLYIESHDPIDAERLAGNGLFKSYVMPFVRKYNRQPHTKRVQILKEIHQLDRQDEQMQVFIKKRESEMDIKPDQYFLIKRAGIGATFKNKLCRVLKTNQKTATASVLTLTPYRSLNSKEKTNPHRIALEEYRELGAEESFNQELAFESGTYYQGLLVLQVAYENLLTIKNVDQAQINQLFLSGRTNDFQAVQLNTQLKPLSLDDQVIIKDFLESGKNLQGSLGIVRELNQDFLYDVLITKAVYPEYNNQVIQVERFQLMKHIPRSSHVKVISEQFYGLTGRVIDLVEDNDKIYLELRADVVEEYIDRSYKITGDDVIISSDTCISLDEVIADEKLFQKNQLVKLNSGMDGVVTFLLYKSARIVTTENRVVNQALSELQPVFNKKRIPIVQDGSNPPQSVSLSSTIRIKDSQTRGKVVQISSQQTGSCLFIQISSGDDVGIQAVLAKNVICVEGGPIISKNKRSQAQMLQGASVKLTDPNYLGREGIFLRQVGEDGKLIEVQLAEKKVTVPRRCISIIGETQVAEKLVEETKARESQFGATQYKQQQYEDWEDDGMNQQKFTQQTQEMNYKTQGNDEDDEGYGGF
ncbi:Conserved_hypothetical protein [Hexamita inflata]|uniref:Uncharacterized protein n=1 Tax=Hexamita inflata TaxID=28002 RepID=A0AA86UZ14_9EUKA|nr:Conserved hypothetical protein [Hexamita inflata]